MDRKELIRRCCIMSETVISAILKEYRFENISRSEFLMLHMLIDREKNGEKATVTAISEQIGISKPAVSQMIKQLEGKKWLKRVADNNDRRLVYVCITDDGREAHSMQVRKIGQRLDSCFAGISDAEIMGLCDSLAIIASKLARTQSV